MLEFFLTTLSTALSLLIVDIVFSGVNLSNFAAAMAAAVVLGIVNSTIRPVLALLSLPITIITLGAYSLVVNGICFWLASIVVPGFEVQGILAFLFGPVILSLGNTVLNNYFAERHNASLKSSD